MAADDPTEKADKGEYLSARDVMRLLDIRRQTLYAYVSRGWIRSIGQAGQKERRYSRDDAERVLSRSRARSGHGPVAAAAMNWGDPVITSQITQLNPQGHLYRQRSAVELAAVGTAYENVAEFLWRGAWPSTPASWPAPSIPPSVAEVIAAPLRSNDLLFELLAIVAIKLGMAQVPPLDNTQTTDAALPAARVLIHAMTGCFGYVGPQRAFSPVEPGESVVAALIRILGVDNHTENRRALEAFLVLFADHELAPGALAARVAAASGGTLHNCVATAIGASSGTLQARLYMSIELFLTSAGTADELWTAATQLHEAGQPIPGFTRHGFYRDGDPRARLLLDIARQRTHKATRLSTLLEFIERMERELHLHARHEVAVIALTVALQLPACSAGPLFALARAAGWIAHVLEQRSSETALRPRAAPSSSAGSPAGT